MVSSKNGPTLHCEFHDEFPLLKNGEAITHLSGTLFASALAGISNGGMRDYYSLQIVSGYLLIVGGTTLEAVAHELGFAADLRFLDSESAVTNVIARLGTDKNALIPFGFIGHAMLLGFCVTEAGIEARIYNSGAGLDRHKAMDMNGTTKYQTCKTVLLEGMNPDAPEFKALLSKCVSAPTTYHAVDDVYGLFEGAKNLPGSELYQSEQKSGNCQLECIMALLLHMLGRERYDEFRLGLITNVYRWYALQDRKDYMEGSPIRAETLARLETMKDRRKQKTVFFADGGSYVGTMKNNMFHGRGVLVLGDGTRYQGDFYQNMYHGKGTLTYSDDAVYEGGFQHGESRGQGTLTYPDGRVYHFFQNGDRYKGDLHLGVPHGFGVLNLSDGTQYEGEFRDGIPHGQVKITYANGNICESQFHGGVYQIPGAT